MPPAPSKQSEMIELGDGDSYDLNVGFIQKKINGEMHSMLAYNGMIPGPIIKVKQGSRVTVNVKNNLDEETTLHSHGVRMDNRFDGVPGITQEPIMPGETFAYELKFPDAGIYWYHPHSAESYQQDLGLYGNFLVVPSDEGYWNNVDREVPLFLDDILIENNRINLEPNFEMTGRFGNVMLVNGETDYVASVRVGNIVRFYVTNSSNARPYNFAIQNAKLKLVGADGGAYEREELKDTVLIGPSERVIVEVLFNSIGMYEIQNITPVGTDTLGNIDVRDNTDGVPSVSRNFEQLKNYPLISKSIDPFRIYFDKAPDKKIDLSFNMGMMARGMMGAGRGMSPQGGILWDGLNPAMNQTMMNGGMLDWKITDKDTGKENMNIDWSFKMGAPAKIRISNNANAMFSMQHPIHFHGQRFLVLERNGRKENNLVWKDTVLVKPDETVDILLEISNPGVWMAHCHIPEHLENGMAFVFEVR